MKIALINENSQAAKNSMIESVLKEVVTPMGHEVVNYGMYAADDEAQLTYVQVGLLTAILLNSGAADFVITGCGTGEGAMLACNSFPGVLCGHVVDPSDAYMFSQINAGNAAAFPFAKGFGWGAELNLQYCFEKLFCTEPGGGYPPERVVPEQRNKKILDGVKKITHTKSRLTSRRFWLKILPGRVRWQPDNLLNEHEKDRQRCRSFLYLYLILYCIYVESANIRMFD